MTRLADLAPEQLVSLTTYRRTGEPVATAVWVAPDAPEVPASVRIVDDPAAVRHLTRPLVAEYGLLARLFFATDAVSRRRQRVVLLLGEPSVRRT